MKLDKVARALSQDIEARENAEKARRLKLLASCTADAQVKRRGLSPDATIEDILAGTHSRNVQRKTDESSKTRQPKQHDMETMIEGYLEASEGLVGTLSRFHTSNRRWARRDRPS